MHQEERREAILQAAVPLFAEKGFHGVKTREIANAAGVSEALVFQHFESKEALFEAIQAYVHGAGEDSEVVAGFLSLPPSTEKLMLGLHMLLTHLAEDAPAEEKVMPRLLLQSLLDDGELARLHLGRFERTLWPAIADALRAAREAGEAAEVGAPDLLLVWFFHHLGFAVRVLKLPGNTIFYGQVPGQLVKHMARFLLRGMGIREEVITTKYNPSTLLQLLA
ncbi:MAG: helix-turn-helix domain-containing protein [bacterium]